MAHYPAWRTNLRQSHYDQVENLDLPPVLDYILSKGGLSHRVVTEIRAIPSPRDRVHRFLDVLHDSSDECLKVFVDGLVKSKQEHLSRLITGVGDAVVMTAQHKLELKRSRLELVHNMDPFMVINHLQSADVLTPYDAERMTSLEARVDQNAALLDTISRKPDHAFGHLVDALKQTKQAHLAKQLDKNVTRHDEEDAKKLKEEIKKLQKEKDELSEEQRKQEKKLKQMQYELAKASSSIQEKDSLITKLQQELSEMNHQLTILQENEKTLVTRLNQQKADHDQEVEQKNSVLKKLQSTIDKQSGELTIAKDQVKQHVKELDRTKNTLTEKEYYIQQLEEELKLLKERSSETMEAKAKIAPHSQTQGVSDLDTMLQAQEKLQNQVVTEETQKVQVHKTCEKDLTSAKLVLDQDLSAICQPLKNPIRVVPLDDGGLLVANVNHVLRVDQQGQQQGTAYTCPSTFYTISALCVHQDAVLVMQYDGQLARLLLTDLSTALQTYKVSVGYLNGGDVIDSDNIVFTDYDKGCICTYNLTTQRQEVVVSGLQHPYSVVYAQTSHGPVFVLTEISTYQVHVYDERWGCRYSMGGQGSGDGQFDGPLHATVTSDGKSILVADHKNKRISQFSMTGQFIRRVLTQKDGVRLPLFLACRNEYVWVIDTARADMYRNRKVTRFKYI